MLTSTGEVTDSMPSFFTWKQGTDNAAAEKHTVKSASASAKVIDQGQGTTTNDFNGTNVAQSTGVREDYSRVKSFMATIETLDLPSSPSPASSYQPTQPVQQDRRLRESVLVIPVFPEPPATLHNRRISQVDARYRPKNQRTLEVAQSSSSFSSDDSESRGGRNLTTRPGVSPQEATNGTPAATGLTARGAYTPITSSEDVPLAQSSKCIYSAARNGDLMELQQFLNSALHRSLSAGSTQSSRRQSSVHPTGLSSTATILDEFEPIERLPVLCCAAVARKNKYQALNMVLKAGANVEGKEQRGGNTPLHLVCETAPPPAIDPSMRRYKEDGGVVVDQEDGTVGVGLVDPKMSQLSLLDLVPTNPEDDDDEDQEVVLKRVDEQDDQEQEALERVKEDSESVFSISTNDDGSHSLLARPLSIPGGAYYQMKNQILMKGGLEDQIRLLVLAGSPIDVPNLRGETPLLLLLRYHDSVTALATLLRLGADPTHMAPFGPGTMSPVEVLMDPKTVLTPDAQKKRNQKTTLKRSTGSGSRLFSSNNSAKQNPLVQQQLLQQQSGEDPNHILIMHGAALAHAAYYLQLDCVRYLLEHEIECSDPVQIEQAIVACQQSVAAQVNPPLVAVQNRILQILERNWKGAIGRRNRLRVAERTLNRKRKPERSQPLLVALAVSTAPAPAPSSFLYSSPTSPHPHNGASHPYLANANSTTPMINGKTSSQSLGAIPTTHLYAMEGPSGQEIELISQFGFPPANGQPQQQHIPRFQVSDMPPTSQPKVHGGHHEHWSSDGGGVPRTVDGRESPENNNKNIFRKFRTMGKGQAKN